MSNPTTDAVLAPHLIVKDAARAIAFYVEALGARELSRATDHKLGELIVHAELALGAARFSLSEEARDWKNDAPTSLGGSPVVLTLTVADARAVGARMERAGATVVFPIADQFYGKRQGRLRDPSATSGSSRRSWRRCPPRRSSAGSTPSTTGGDAERRRPGTAIAPRSPETQP